MHSLRSKKGGLAARPRAFVTERSLVASTEVARCWRCRTFRTAAIARTAVVVARRGPNVDRRLIGVIRLITIARPVGIRSRTVVTRLAVIAVIDNRAPISAPATKPIPAAAFRPWRASLGVAAATASAPVKATAAAYFKIVLIVPPFARRPGIPGLTWRHPRWFHWPGDGAFTIPDELRIGGKLRNRLWIGGLRPCRRPNLRL